MGGERKSSRLRKRLTAAETLAPACPGRVSRGLQEGEAGRAVPNGKTNLCAGEGVGARHVQGSKERWKGRPGLDGEGQKGSHSFLMAVGSH